MTNISPSYAVMQAPESNALLTIVGTGLLNTGFQKCLWNNSEGTHYSSMTIVSSMEAYCFLPSIAVAAEYDLFVVWHEQHMEKVGTTVF